MRVCEALRVRGEDIQFASLCVSIVQNRSSVFCVSRPCKSPDAADDGQHLELKTFGGMLRMTRSKKLFEVLKKLLHLPRYDIQVSLRSSGRRMRSFSSSEISGSRSRGASNRSTVYVVDCDCEEECWTRSSPPHDVPAGSFPVYVGEERRRFVIPTSYLKNNVFRVLLDKSEEEYGLRCNGGLRIACSPDIFEHFLWWLEGETTHKDYSENMKRSFSGRSV